MHKIIWGRENEKLLHNESQAELLENSVFQEKIRRQKKKLVSEEGKKDKE